MPNLPQQEGSYLGGLAAKVDSADVYLGDPDAVDAIIRGFTVQVLAAFQEADQAWFSRRLTAACEDTAGVFVGTIAKGKRVKDQAEGHFLPVADWNREGGGLGQWVRPRFADQIENIDAMTDGQMLANVFAIMAHAMADVLEKMGEDEDGQDASLSIDALIEDWRNLVMGIPNEDDTTASMLLIADQTPPTDYDGNAGE